MAQFAPVSRNSMPYSEILGPVSAISAALESQGVRFAIEGAHILLQQMEYRELTLLHDAGKAALLIELYTSVDLSKLQVLDEMLKTQTPISTMVSRALVLRRRGDSAVSLTLGADHRHLG